MRRGIARVLLTVAGLSLVIAGAVMIQPVIIVRPRVFIAPTRVVVLSPSVPTLVSIFPLAAMVAPPVEPTFDPPTVIQALAITGVP